MKYGNIREEELKNKIAQDYFWLFDCTRIMGNVDFCVAMHHNPQLEQEVQSLFWAEAKKGVSDIYKSIVQLILTIGKARTFDQYLPPALLGAFDAEKMAFLPYEAIYEVFYRNDFNWNVTPSKQDSKEFQLLYTQVKQQIEQQALCFRFVEDEAELHAFINQNFERGRFGLRKTKIDKNNFMVVYNKWLQAVKPSIDINWELVRKKGLIDGDFYLADLLAQENYTLKEKLFVLLKKDYYELDRRIDDYGLLSSSQTGFLDKQVKHTQFWNRYERPPKEEYWDYIVERRDLLVPQDIRERKGSFFTPQIWVERSQQYLAEVLGEDWQENHYVWDCAAGTGNLLSGLTNKHRVWASTLDKQDVEVMQDRIANGANLLSSHVFQFDFLNDDFSRLPKSLQAVIADPEKQKRLIIYINPPYAEASDRATVVGKGENKTAVATEKKGYEDATLLVGTAARELFTQFFVRIYQHMPQVKLASFSTLKFINAQNFDKFRQYFQAKFKKGFIVPADTFDNVKGKFPIGFTIWDLSEKAHIGKISCSVYGATGQYQGKKTFSSVGKGDYIIHWLRLHYDKQSSPIAYLRMQGTDMQNNQGVFFTLKPSANDFKKHLLTFITRKNILPMCVYFAVRHCIPPTWLNDRDQFLSPKKAWAKDLIFQSDCLVYALFHGQNKISVKDGTNHWIPFTEAEVGAADNFESNFMSQFIKGKIRPEEDKPDIFTVLEEPKTPYERALVFSAAAQAVLEAGKALWRYYQAQPKVEVNASFYDIRAYFQGRAEGGRMQAKSEDETYTNLLTELKKSLKDLAAEIEAKVYTYEFLKL